MQTFDAKAIFTNACSARLCSDFNVTKPLSSWPAFAHENCRRDRKPKQMQFSVKPVEDQILREMRHKIKNHEHNGRIASCRKCSKYFSINGIIKIALNVHLGNTELEFHFPNNNANHWIELCTKWAKTFCGWMKTITKNPFDIFPEMQ